LTRSFYTGDTLFVGECGRTDLPDSSPKDLYTSLFSKLSVLENDTEETLSARILEQEHKIYPQAVKLFAEGRLKIEGRKVKII
jgi:glyoxylase-like metal-dependent hydrolase (beta-lactamase superfamily II)